MIKEKSASLWAYITNQEETINNLYSKIESLQPLNEDKLINLAYQLHNLYSAFEDIFKEVSQTFENNIASNSGFHKNLLIRMKLEIPGIRPNMLSRTSYEVLGELLGFRHVFRHAYNYNLSPQKMQFLRDKILTNKENFSHDISQFKIFLEKSFK
jgi:hypothetical protein